MVHFVSVVKFTWLELPVVSPTHLVSVGSIVMSFLSFPMLMMCVFSFYYLSVWLEVYQFYSSFERTSFWLYFSLLCFCFKCYWFSYHFLSSACLGLFCSSFAIFLRWIVDLRLFFSNISIYCPKFLLKDCFYCIPHILICFIFIFLSFTIFSNFFQGFPFSACIF